MLVNTARFLEKEQGILVWTCGKAEFLQEEKKSKRELFKKTQNHYLLCTSL